MKIHEAQGGTLTVNGDLTVSTGGTTCAAAERVSTLTSVQEALVEPCTHSNTYTRIDDSKHTVTCQWCGHSTEESHVAEGVCPCESTDITLADATDNASVISKYDRVLVSSVTLTGRKLWKDNSWNTLCLPFALCDFTGTPLEGAMVKTLASSSFNEATGTLTLNFSENSLTAIEAGKPYIVKWAAQTPDCVENPVFNNITIDITARDVATDAVTFTGTYAPVSIASTGDNTKLYLAASNTLYWPDGAMTIGCQRAYFQLASGITAGDKASQARAFVLNFGDGEQTGILSLFTDSKDNADGISEMVNGKWSNGKWFDMQGRRLSGKPSRAGVYINSGKKVAIQ